jgi:cyanophycin synthetase
MSGRLAGLAGLADVTWSLRPSTALRHRRLANRQSQGKSPHANLYELIWSEAAAAAGAEMSSLPGGATGFRRGGASARVWRHTTDLDGPVSLRLALDREHVLRALAAGGVPVPWHASMPGARPAAGERALREAPGRYVVKPARGSAGGHGITCNVQSPADLRRAARVAARFDAEIVLERQAPGAMYRVTYLDGEVIGIVRRDRPTVTGDGRSTVAELILAENGRRVEAVGTEGVVLIRPDLDCALTLASQGLDAGSVPAEGDVVAVKTSSSENAPRDNHTISGRPAFLDEAAAAARASELRFCGVDLVTDDPGRTLAEAGGCVIEVNGTPGLHYHYLVADPAGAQRIAIPLLERLLSR